MSKPPVVISAAASAREERIRLQRRAPLQAVARDVRREVEQQDGNAGVGEVRGDLRAHRARAEHRDRANQRHRPTMLHARSPSAARRPLRAKHEHPGRDEQAARRRRRTGCSATGCRPPGTARSGPCRRRRRTRRCTASTKRSTAGRARSTAAARIVGVHERQLAVVGLPPRPRRRQRARRTRRSRAPGCAARTAAVPSASYFRNTGSPAWKTKKKPPVGIDERDAAVQRDVQRRVVFVAGRPQLAERPDRRRPRSVYSVISAPVSGCDIRIDVPVYCSDPMPFSDEAVEHDARPASGRAA